jgi:periplasmic protein TonB
MIDTGRHPIDRANPETAGWVVSCLLHGGLAIGAVLFFQSLRLVPQAEPFTWDVAMTASSSPETTMARPVTPPAPPVSAQSSTDLAPAQPALLKPEPVETAMMSPASIEPTPPLPTVSSYAAPAPQHALPTPAEPIPSAQTDSPPTATDLPTNQQIVPAPEPQAMSHAHPEQSKPVKVDYGWLSDLMAKWIEDLDKRYPVMLRTEGIQGKVTLTALLHEDGTLSDVRVAKSSGNTMLDQVAVEDVRKGPPITLARPLERPHMPVKFSIIYDLKTAR